MSSSTIASGNRFAFVTADSREMLRMVTSRDKLKGRYVTFSVRDVHHPQPAAILHQLHDDERLSGTVLDLSHDSRAKDAAFAIVKVARVRQLCIVPVDSLKPVRRATRARARR
jgi:hypothetical protein